MHFCVYFKVYLSVLSELIRLSTFKCINSLTVFFVPQKVHFKRILSVLIYLGKHEKIHFNTL